MDFFNKFFGRDETFVPTPNQQVTGIPPIVVQAIENLFPNIDSQKYAFDYVIQLKEKGKTYHEPRLLLAILFYSKGSIRKLPDMKAVGDYYFMMDEIEHIFPKRKDAEEWVKSITKPPFREDR